MDKNLPASAGDVGLIPAPRRSHVPWSNSAHLLQLQSPSCRAQAPQLLKPVYLEPVLRKRRGHHNERLTQCNEE